MNVSTWMIPIDTISAAHLHPCRITRHVRFHKVSRLLCSRIQSEWVFLYPIYLWLKEGYSFFSPCKEKIKIKLIFILGDCSLQTRIQFHLCSELLGNLVFCESYHLFYRFSSPPNKLNKIHTSIPFTGFSLT